MSLSGTLADSALGRTKKAFLIMHRTPDDGSIDSNKIAQKTDAVLSQAMLLGPTVSLSSLLTLGGMQANIMEVQYNPSSLSLNSNAQSIPFTYMQKNVDNGVPNQNVRPPQVVLSVELMFDAMNTQDAFMSSKLQLSTGAAISSRAALKKLKKGEFYTVQPQTNALIGALMMANTRFVTFRWGDMAFTGQMTEVQADYTMFSVSGRPIRSKVRLNISQQVQSNADIKYWDKAFDQAFTEDEKTGESGGKGVAQQLGNLLNLNAF